MKVLFVCQRNNGRSQIAKALYNKLTDTNDADSAGTEVDNDGQLLKDRAAEKGSEVSKVIDIMKELDIDVSSAKRSLLKPDTLNNYDKIVAIMKPETMPQYLANHPKMEHWNIEDPRVKDLNGVRQTRDQIKSQTSKLIKSN